MKGTHPQGFMDVYLQEHTVVAQGEEVEGCLCLKPRRCIHSLNFQFLGGPSPRSPFPDCGIEGWIDALDCREYPPCG